jgi:twinkle protein
MMTVTYFDNFRTVNDPKFFPVDMVLERIKNGASKELIEQLRAITDPEQQKDFKLNRLPLICFSGQFTRRAAVAFKKASGLAIMDWDDVQAENLRDLQTIIISEPYTYACWVSPRGGLKALIRIADAEKYKEQYEALLDYFNGLTIDYCQADKANKDIARGCFESYDPDLYINREAKPFQYYIKHERMEMPTYESKVELIPRILKWTASKNQYFQDGQRNHFILCFAGACCRFGIDQYDCMAFCDNQFLANDTSFSRKECEQTIANAYRFWQNQFGTAEFNSGKVVDTKTLMEIDVAPPAELFDTSQPAKDVVYGASVIDRALDLLENGLPYIEGIGIPMLDDMFKFRRGEITLLSGHGNHGKSSIMKYMMLCHAAIYGRKFAIFPPEDNPAELFYHDLVEILLGCECSPTSYNRPNKEGYEKAYRWVSDHFFYIYPETESPTPAYIKQRFLELIIKEKVDGCIIDPFNQMDNDISRAGGRDDQYLSIVLGDFARFAAQNNVYFFILSHPKGGGKKTNGDNYPCPDVYDLAGGAMWNNKMWNILIYHRPLFYSMPLDPTCELHAKKIKRKEVGKRGFIQFEYKYQKRRFLFHGGDPMEKILGDLNLNAYLPTPKVIAPNFEDSQELDDEPPF